MQALIESLYIIYIMQIPDLITMIENVSRAIAGVGPFLMYTSFIIGILCFIKALAKFKKIGDARVNSTSHEKVFVPVVYTLVGAALIYLPSSIGVLSNTAFGSDSILQYSDFNNINLTAAVEIIVKTVGVIWFMRGCVLLAHASEPGVQHGPKGLSFLVAGIFAVNFTLTLSAFNYVVEKLIHITLSIKDFTGN